MAEVQVDPVQAVADPAMRCLTNCGCQCNEGGCGCHEDEQFSVRVINIRIPFEVELAVKILGGLVVLAGVVHLVRKVRRD